MVLVPEPIRRDLLHVCRRLYERGLVAGTDGNVSVRLTKDRILATPTGMSKGFLEADDLVVCDLQGRQVSGKRRLTTEIKIHLAVYTQREDVCAVVHAHPPHATAFAVARKPLEERLMPEAYIAVGKVALTEYGTPSTEELEASIRPAAKEHDAILLANHGAVTVGRDVIAAYHRMEALEQLARISMLTQVLGGAQRLTADEIARLEAIRGIYGGAPANLPCYHCGWTPDSGSSEGRARVGETGATGKAGGFEERSRRGELPAASGAGSASSAGPRPTSYVEPEVHWPGNPPVWERHAASDAEAQIRDLARRALREVREGG